MLMITICPISSNSIVSFLQCNQNHGCAESKSAVQFLQTRFVLQMQPNLYIVSTAAVSPKEGATESWGHLMTKPLRFPDSSCQVTPGQWTNLQLVFAFFWDQPLATSNFYTNLTNYLTITQIKLNGIVLLTNPGVFWCAESESAVQFP